MTKTKKKEHSVLIRFGVSIPEDLINAFDTYIRERQYGSRSEAIRDLIREKLVEQEWEKEAQNEDVVGTTTYVFDHHKWELVE